jgi:DNA-binding response OmpR family regulator
LDCPKVLAVDGNLPFLHMMKEVLETKGFEVIPAANLADALRSMVAQPFDALITELQMPQTEDGFTIVNAMRHCQPKVLRIVISASLFLEGPMVSVPQKADKILLKPFDFDQVAELIRKRSAR